MDKRAGERRAIQPRVAPLVTVRSSLNVDRCAFALAFTRQISLKSKKPNFLWTDGHTYIRTERFEIGFVRSTLKS